jgi:UDP-N-acetyl-D-mannosaminuronic acid dehydrogenase
MKNSGKTPLNPDTWSIEKIAVAGPGIVGMPMAALLAHARIQIGTNAPASVLVVQRNSDTSGWKVDAINSGNSVIGGIEPELEQIVAEAVADGRLEATHDYQNISDADVVLVCVQTDKDGFAPDYGPLKGSITEIARALQKKPKQKVPLIIFESTLAPSSMATIITEHFREFGLEEGKDILLGNSPNRVMPGRLTERVRDSDKIVAGMNRMTPELIQRLYSHVVTRATLHRTNSLTAELVKTLENAYRDVRIAFTNEIVRYCDSHQIDFYAVRDQVNTRLAQSDAASNDPTAVPSGGLLIPTTGVGGHCLPKDGILMWWRKIESGAVTENSLILESRKINDEAPAELLRVAEERFGSLSGKRLCLLGAAYRFNSEDTRNSPTLELAKQLMSKGCKVLIHDPYVKPTDQNLKRYALQDRFTRDIPEAVTDAEYLFFCTAHSRYQQEFREITRMCPNLKGIIDGCNLFHASDFNEASFGYVGIGRESKVPKTEFIDFVEASFRVMERGVANEVLGLVHFLNDNYADSGFNRIDFKAVQHIAGTCVTGCAIADPGPIDEAPAYHHFTLRLVQKAYHAYQKDGQSILTHS